MIKEGKFFWRVLSETASRYSEHHGGFLASGLAFDILLCILPFMLVLVSISGYFLESSTQAQQEILTFFERVLPGAMTEVQSMLAGFLRNRKIIGLVGVGTLLLAASRVFAGIRVVINIAFSPRRQFNWLTGKLFDVAMVVLAGILLLLSICISSFITVWRKWGEDWMASYDFDVSNLESIAGRTVATVLSVILFFLMYRLPLLEPVPTRILVLQATIVGLLWEMAKRLFEYYLANLGRFDVLYDSLGVLVVLVLWIYYSAVIFVAGAELGSTMYSLTSRGRRPKPGAP